MNDERTRGDLDRPEAEAKPPREPSPTPIEDVGPDIEAAPAEAKAAEPEAATTSTEPHLPDYPARAPNLLGRARGRRLAKKDASTAPSKLSAEQRLLILDTWQKSGLPAGEFSSLVGIARHTLYTWKARFDEAGPAGLADRPRKGSMARRLPELTRRAILMLKEAHPDFGTQRISDMLLRGPALPVSASTVARVLHEAGYDLEEEPTRAHPDHPRSFERARPNQLWQTDLFTFTLKRQNRRVHLVAFMDDHSRFLVSHGLYASPSTALVIETLRAGITNYGPPEELLTDNGPQYVTWRGKSAFTRELEARGIKQVVSAPRHPQTLCQPHAYVDSRRPLSWFLTGSTSQESETGSPGFGLQRTDGTDLG